MKALFIALDTAILTLCACAVGLGLLLRSPLFVLLLLLYVPLNIIPSPHRFRIRSFRLRVCGEGSDLLLVFLFSAVLTAAVFVPAGFKYIPDPDARLFYLIAAASAPFVLGVVFWNGILRVYLTSVQLGIKHRVLGILLAIIPLWNVVYLCYIIILTDREVRFEVQKQRRDEERAQQRVCATKYPLLLVHGVFFRDSDLLNYWGRIPAELEKNGADIYYGNHQSAAAISACGEELSERIREVAEKTGCGKVNIIAHSKGGLDCRYAISRGGAAQYVASLTTINTPHRGCLFADYLLSETSVKIKHSVARTYNRFLRKLGDSKPDFLAAVNDLTARSCEEFNRETPDSPEVYYQSFGSRLNRARAGKFPMNLTFHVAKAFGGSNDGLVAENSFPWGSSFRLLTTSGRRGISHGDMVDLNRENIRDFDVREFYVQLVADLKEKGF